MDQPGRSFIHPRELYAQLGTAAAPVVIDVRPDQEFAADAVQIVAAIRRNPTEAAAWRATLPENRRVVVYCRDGGGASAAVAASLGEAGTAAAILEGGIALWRHLGLPTRMKRGGSPSRWVTRERPKVDRIACPWLVRRFIDPDAEFLYVPSDVVRAVADRTGAIPYDVAGAEFGHAGEQCSFDAFLRLFAVSDPVLDRLALIVRGADTGRPELTPQSAGLMALSHGLSATVPDDHAMLAHGMVIYDALYAWCRSEVRA